MAGGSVVGYGSGDGGFGCDSAGYCEIGYNGGNRVVGYNGHVGYDGSVCGAGYEAQSY